MKKINKVILICLLLLSSIGYPVFARTEEYYAVDITSITDSKVKEYINSLQLRGEGDMYRVIVNNESIGSVTSAGGSLTYYPNSSVSIRINIDTANQKVTFNYSAEKTRIVTSVFYFYPSPYSEDISMMLDIYPDDDSSEFETLTAKESGGVFDFGSYSYTFGDNYTLDVSDIYINTSNNTAYICYSGGVKTCSWNSGTRELEVYVETHVTAHELELDYMESGLTKLTFPKASAAGVVQYSESQINGALKNARITLKNNATGITKDESLIETITYWERVNTGAAIGDGIYNTKVAPRQIQVVCQWWEQACSSVRSDYGVRWYAVYGKNYNYDSVSLQNATHYLKRYVEEEGDAQRAYPAVSDSSLQHVEYKYRIATANDTGWLSKTDYYNLINSYTGFDYEKIVNLQTRDATRYTYYSYGSWSDYYPATEKPSYFSYSGYEEQKGETLYRYRYASNNTTYSGWVSATPSSGAYSYDSYQSRILYNCPTSASAKSCTITNGSYCGFSYSNFGEYKTSKYGSYTGGCTSRTGKNSECGVASYSFSNWSGYKTSKYGYTTQCTSRSGNNSECGVSSYTYSSYGSYSDSKYGSYTSQCKSKTVNTTCKSYNTSGSACGYSYSNYGYYSSTWGHYNCGSKISSGSHKGKYYCAGSRSAKSCAAAGCASYNTKTQYSCPTSRTANYSYCTSYNCPTTRTENYNSCTGYSCPSTRSEKTCTVTTGTMCGYSYSDYGGYRESAYGNFTSQCVNITQYNYKKTSTTWSDWSSWSTSSPPGWIYTSAADEETQTTYQVRARSRTLSSTGWYAGSGNCSGSDCPRQEDIISTYKYSDEYGEPYQWRSTIYEYGSWSGWENASKEYSIEHWDFMYRLVEKVLKSELVSDYYAVKKSVSIGTLAKQTESMIEAQASEMDSAYADNELLSALTGNTALQREYNEFSNAYILWSSFSSAKSANASAMTSIKNNSTSGTAWKNSALFIPYIYIIDHIRANYITSMIDGYSESKSTSIVGEDRELTTSNGTGDLLKLEEQIDRDSKVIYMNYLDPLSNYDDDLPQNWEGYESLVEKIENTDLEGIGKIKVSLSYDDLEDMRNYIKEHSEDLDECQMIKEFSYIFVNLDEEMSDFLSGGNCRVEEDE